MEKEPKIMAYPISNDMYELFWEVQVKDFTYELLLGKTRIVKKGEIRERRDKVIKESYPPVMQVTFTKEQLQYIIDVLDNLEGIRGEFAQHYKENYEKDSDCIPPESTPTGN